MFFVCYISVQFLLSPKWEVVSYASITYSIEYSFPLNWDTSFYMYYISVNIMSFFYYIEQLVHFFYITTLLNYIIFEMI